MKMPQLSGRWRLRPHLTAVKAGAEAPGPRRRVARIGAVVASVVIAAGLVAVPSAAMAYTKTGVSWTTGKLTIDYRYVNGTFRTALNNSNSNYNSATRLVLKTTDTAGPSWKALNANYGATGWEGQASWSSNIFYQTTACTMQLNQYYLSGAEPAAQLKVVWEHESGHCLGLGHVTSSSRVMYTSASTAYFNGVTSLTSDEINGINTMY